MKSFFSKRIVKLLLALICLAGNIAFYTWGIEDGTSNGWTGAEAAYEVNLMFFIFCQGLFACGVLGFGWFFIKNK